MGPDRRTVWPAETSLTTRRATESVATNALQEHTGCVVYAYTKMIISSSELPLLNWGGREKKK